MRLLSILHKPGFTEALGSKGADRVRTLRAGDRVGSVLALAAVALGAGLGLSLHGGAAQSQDPPQFLVANFSQTGSGTHYSFRMRKVDEVAQEFTTGNNGAGYLLTSIQIRMNGLFRPHQIPRVIIRSKSVRGTQVAALQSPTSVIGRLNHDYTFTAAEPVMLAPSTSYWVVISSQELSADLVTTSSGGEDSDSLAGWSIRNRIDTWSTEYGPQNPVQVSHIERNAPSLNTSAVMKLIGAAVDDTAAPAVTSASVIGDTLIVKFGEALDGSATLANSAFTVKKTPLGGTEETVALDSNMAPSISGATVALKLGAAVAATDTAIKVTYAKPSSGSGNKLADFAGNETASFSDQAVSHDTAPTLSSASLGADGRTVTLTFNESLAETLDISVASFSVKATTAQGAERTFSPNSKWPVRVIGAQVSFELEDEIVHSDTAVEVSYSRPGAGRVIEDAAGHDASSFTDQTATNNSQVPTVTIEPVGTTAIVGRANALFRAQTSLTMGYPISVRMRITQDNDYLSDFHLGRSRINIEAGETTGDLWLLLMPNLGNGMMRAAVSPGHFYRPDPAQVQSDPLHVIVRSRCIYVGWGRNNYQVAEGDSLTATATLTTCTGDPKPWFNVAYHIGHAPRETELGADWQFIAGAGSGVVTPDDWTGDGDRTFSVELPVSIQTSTDVTAEGRERFQLSLGIGPNEHGFHNPSCPSSQRSGHSCVAFIDIYDEVLIDRVFVSPDAGPDSVYTQGETITIRAVFHNEVEVSGAPKFAFTLNGVAREAVYDSGSGAAALDFVYIMTADDGSRNDDEIGWNANSIVLNGATISAGDSTLGMFFDVDLSHPGRSARQAPRPDTTPPIATSTTFDSSRITLTFNENLDESSVPDDGDFAIFIDDLLYRPYNVQVQGNTVVLDMNGMLEEDDLVELFYNPGSNPLQDLNGNDVLPPGTQWQPVADFTAHTTPVDDDAVEDDPPGGGSGGSGGAAGASGGGGFGGGGGAPPVAAPSEADFDWNVTRDIESLAREHDEPTGMWSDGETLRLLHNAASGADRLFAYDLDSGERVEQMEFELDRRNRFAHGIWSDGETAWVSDSGQDRLFAYILASGERVEELEFDLAERNRDPRGIWSDGQTLVVLDAVKDALFGYDPASGELAFEHALDPLNRSPRGIWSDGLGIWISDDGANRVFAYRLEENGLRRVEAEEFGFRVLLKAGAGEARGIWSDGDTLWLADAEDAEIYSFNLPDAIQAQLASLALSDLELDFSPRRLNYSLELPPDLDETTVEATAAQTVAAVSIEPPDADLDPGNGHQVALDGIEPLTVTVTSQDGSRSREYRVTFERAACFDGQSEDVDELLRTVEFVGGGLDALEACAREHGISALYHFDGDSWRGLFLDAPDFLSRPFRSFFAGGLPKSTELISVRLPTSGE